MVILAHMAMNRWQTKQMNGLGAKHTANERGQELVKGSGHGRQNGRQAKHSLLNKALQADTAGRLSARHRPQNKRPTVGRPRSEQQPQMTSASRRAGKWGSAVVLRKAGSNLPILSLPQLSPLPVTVPTHSLNL